MSPQGGRVDRIRSQEDERVDLIKKAARHGREDEGGSMHAQVGDGIEIDSAEVGTSPRKGTILEVRGEPGQEHYQVRWRDGHESVFFPASTAHVINSSERSRGSGHATP